MNLNYHKDELSVVCQTDDTDMIIWKSGSHTVNVTEILLLHNPAHMCDGQGH